MKRWQFALGYVVALLLYTIFIVSTFEPGSWQAALGLSHVVLALILLPFIWDFLYIPEGNWQQKHHESAVTVSLIEDGD